MGFGEAMQSRRVLVPRGIVSPSPAWYGEAVKAKFVRAMLCLAQRSNAVMARPC